MVTINYNSSSHYFHCNTAISFIVIHLHSLSLVPEETDLVQVASSAELLALPSYKRTLD